MIAVNCTVELVATPRPAGSDMAALIRRALLVAARAVLVPAIRETVSILGPPPSEPGYPPHVRPEWQRKPTDPPHLRDSIAAWEEDGAVVVGCTGNFYGIFLELGTQNMAARPWLLPTLLRSDVAAAFESVMGSTLADLLAQTGGGSVPPDIGSESGSVPPHD